MRLFIFFLFSTLVFSKEIYWQNYTAKTAHHSGHHSKRAAMFQLVGLDEGMRAKIFFTTPDLVKKEISLEKNIFSMPKTGLGGFYLLKAEIEKDEKIYTATKYIHKYGKPSKISPEKLITPENKYLEIIPAPFPREHDSYKEGGNYKFLVQENGKDLKKFTVKLETTNGNIESFQGENAEVTITLPNDFQKGLTIKDRRKNEEFFLIVESGKFTSSFSAPYYLSPTNHYQNQMFGAVTIAIGFLGGVALMRRRRENG